MHNSITKALAQITETAQPGSSDAPYGGFTAILSTPALDRDGDRLATSEWKTPLPDHITVDIDHEMSVRGTVGSARPYIDADGNLLIDARFASTPTAQEVRTLINEGHIKTVSVAFMTDRNVKSGKPSRELLNAGIVAIPSNRDALILSSKAGARNSAADRAAIQSIHDASGQLGAACETGDDTGAGDGANMRSTSDAETKSATDGLAVLDVDAFASRLAEMIGQAINPAASKEAGTPQDSHDESTTTPAEPPADAAPQGSADAAGDAAAAADESGDDVAAAQAELEARLALLSLAETELSESEIP